MQTDTDISISTKILNINKVEKYLNLLQTQREKQRNYKYNNFLFIYFVSD